MKTQGLKNPKPFRAWKMPGMKVLKQFKVQKRGRVPVMKHPNTPRERTPVMKHPDMPGERNLKVSVPVTSSLNTSQDAHEWHITQIKGKPISIPLPVILYSKTQGLLVFMSSKFEHGHADYKGFRIEESGDNKGKIVAEDGTLPLDLSITKNVVGIFFSLIILFWVFLSAGRAYKKNPMDAPKGIQSVVEPVIVFVRDEVAIPSIGEKKYEKFMPFLLTIFFFILINNLLGLIPIPPAGANVTGNIAVPLVLAFFTMIVINFNGNRNYWRHIFNTPGRACIVETADTAYAHR